MQIRSKPLYLLRNIPSARSSITIGIKIGKRGSNKRNAAPISNAPKNRTNRPKSRIAPPIIIVPNIVFNYTPNGR